MFTNLINRLKFFFKKRFDEKLILSANAYFKIARKDYNFIESLKDVEFKVFSQNGEDGIIDYLINALEFRKLKFVEIGVGDYTECNTRFLTNYLPFTGLVCDFNTKLKENIENLIFTHRGKIQTYNNFIYEDNILEVLKKYGFFNNVNFFSLDIDGNDYFILKQLPNSFSDIFIAEYNQNFGSTLEICTPYIKNFNRFKYHYSGLCWGVSIKALIKLMYKKGYIFLGTNTECCNAFFVKKNLINKINQSIYKDNNLSETCNDYICDARDSGGKLIYLSIQERLEVIKNLEVIDLSNNDLESKVKISDLL